VSGTFLFAARVGFLMKRGKRVVRRARRPAKESLKPAGLVGRRRKSHPFSAIKPFLAVLALLLTALYAIIAFGVRLSPLSITLFAVFVLLISFAVAVAYLTHSREYHDDEPDFFSNGRFGAPARVAGSAAGRRRNR
jgi:fatty acid desaturase